MTESTLVKVERVEDGATMPADDVTDIAAMRRNVFAITPASSNDDVVRMLGTVDVLKNMVKELEQDAKGKTEEWVTENKRPVTFGPFKWRMGTETEVEWIDEAGAIDDLFHRSGGDWSVLLRDFLGKNPMKHGSAEEAWGEELAMKYFKRVEKTVLKNNVAEKKRALKKVDTRYIK